MQIKSADARTPSATHRLSRIVPLAPPPPDACTRARPERDHAARRRRRKARERRGLIRQRIGHVTPVAPVPDAPLREHTPNASFDRAEKPRQFVALSRRGAVKLEPIVRLRKHAVQHQRVDVHVEIERRPEALQDGHGPGAPIADAGAPGSTTQPTSNRPRVHGHDGTTERMIPGQQVPQPRRQREHPLPHGHIWKHAIHQMRGALRHATPPAARAEAAALAGERDQLFVATSGTPKPREAGRQISTGQELAELPFNETRQPISTEGPHLRAQRLEMLQDNPMQYLLFGRAWSVSR